MRGGGFNRRRFAPANGGCLPLCAGRGAWVFTHPTGFGKAPELVRGLSRDYLSCIALSTLGGDMGRSVMRTPAAAETALAMAARGGTMEVSPTPRTP
ncbi:hypothetical protein FIU89_14365 [Roseovarius sp. THAF27]|nr:hypothetical protein FIU89_14365 [Roseovarius sp. THAF27]